MSVKWLGKLMFAAPWAVSLALHAAVILPLVFVVMISAEKPAPDVVYPVAGFSEAPAGQFDGSDGGDDAQGPLNAVASPVEAHRPSAEAPAPLVGPADGSGGRIELIGIGGGGQAGGTPGTLGFAVAGGVPRGSFFGIKAGGNAHHFVYVIDSSGSLFSGVVWDILRKRLADSVRGLSEQQDFHIIFFGENKVIENPPKRLVPANNANKTQALKFAFKVVTSGKTDPIPALRRAFEVLRAADQSKPGMVIYFLTDGDPEQGTTVDVFHLLDDLNRDRKVIVNTVLLNPDASNALVKQIADKNGGECASVNTK